MISFIFATMFVAYSAAMTYFGYTTALMSKSVQWILEDVKSSASRTEYEAKYERLLPIWESEQRKYTDKTAEFEFMIEVHMRLILRQIAELDEAKEDITALQEELDRLENENKLKNKTGNIIEEV